MKTDINKRKGGEIYLKLKYFLRGIDGVRPYARLIKEAEVTKNLLKNAHKVLTLTSFKGMQ